MLIKQLLRKFHHHYGPPRSWPYHLKYYLTLAFTPKCLLFTNTVISGTLMALGDLIEQEFEFQTERLAKRYDIFRLGRMLAIGLTLGPIYHYYYAYLNKRYPDRTLTATMKKMIFDQIVMSPFVIVWICTGLYVLNERSMQSFLTEFPCIFIDVYRMDCMMWLPTQFINFHFLKVNYQVVFNNMVSTIYNTFLSFYVHKKETIAKFD